MYLLLALMLIPIIEIALFIKVGGLIGLGWTLAIVVGTAALGSYLIRRQGVAAMSSLRERVSTLRDPTEPLFDGAAILIAGAFLLTPGFLTDTLGLLLLAPPIRHALYRALRARITVVSSHGGHQDDPFGGPDQGVRPRPDDVIEGDYEVVDQKSGRH